ncbi:MAG: hypothetical protein NZL89_05325, partial [Leptospiraceae bacterium]|nr:hypothetical protein [Leptospiraceae bacterium]
FAMAEKQYADRVRQEILQAEEVCLIAPFAFAPETEPPPYSRARELWQTRKSAKRPTKIIHLPTVQ